MISFFCSRDIQVFLLCKFNHWLCNCASTLVWHKIKNISANNAAMLLKQCYWSNAVVPYEIYHMVHILMLLWQHARFQSPASSKLNITICDSTRQNTRSYLRCMPVPPSLDLLFNFFNCIFCPMQLQMVIFDFEEEGTGRETILRLTWCTQCSKVCMNFKRFWNGQSCGGFRPWENP